MDLDATARRRWFGALVLLAALGMLVAGVTVLEARLAGLGFVCYWLACLLLTGLAIFVAFLDVRALGRRTREAQRDLFQATLKQIETEAKSRARPHDRKR